MAKSDVDLNAPSADKVAAVAETPSASEVDLFADKVADKLGKSVGEMFKEYKAQLSENAEKALEGKPEEASQPDAENVFKAKSAHEWLRELGQAAGFQKDADAGLDRVKALSIGAAEVLACGDRKQGLNKALKTGQLAGNEAFVARALGMDDFSSGGALTQSQMAAEVVPALLSEKGVFGDPSIMVLPVEGQLDIPYENSSPTERWTAENAAANATDVGFDQVTLRPEAVSIIVPVSMKLLRNSAVAARAIEQSIRNRFEERVDAKLIRSIGASNTPIGLRYLVHSDNIKTANASVSAANTDVDLLRLVQALQDAKVPLTSRKILLAPRTVRYLYSLRGTDEYLYRQELLAGRLVGAEITGQSKWGVQNIPTNLSYTGTSESEIIMYETSGLRLGVGDNMTMTQSNVAAYNDSSGSVQAALSRNQVVMAMHAEIGLVEVYRGKGIAVIPDCDWGA